MWSVLSPYIHTQTMGSTLQQHRVAIGVFNGRTKLGNCDQHRPLHRKFMKFWTLFLLTSTMQLQLDPWIVFLLTICGDIEINPGPKDFADITICNVNIRSLNAKSRHGHKLTRFEAFKNALAGKYDIITATETWLNADHDSSNYDLPGYTGPFRLDRPDGSAYGGVAAWVIGTLAAK